MTPRGFGRAAARRRALAASLAVAYACVLHAGAGAAASAKARSHTIVMEGTTYSPQTLTVNHGDKIVWVNKDPFPHTATADDKSFDSKSIGAGRKWSYTAKKRGEFPYLCTLHPTMKATLTVK